AAGISDSLVRLSVGIESPEDLARDLTHALDRCVRVSPAKRRHPQRSQGSAVNSDVVLLGVGSIGRELISQLSDSESAPVRVVGLIDRSGYVFDEDGFSSAELCDLCEHKATGEALTSADSGQPATALQALHEIARHTLTRPILVDATPAETSDVLQFALSR